MLKSVVSVLLVSAIAALPVSAATITDRGSCDLGVQDAQKMRAASDAGPKVNQQSDELIAVATSLCEQGNHAEAEKVLGVLRSMLSTE